MDMATFIVLAVAWWSAQGAVEPGATIPWDWDTSATQVEQRALQTDPNICGWSDIGSRQITIVRACWDTIDTATKCGLVTHEVGHAIGLEHSADPNHVMAPAFANPDYCEASPFYSTPLLDPGEPTATDGYEGEVVSEPVAKKKRKAKTCKQKTAKRRKACRQKLRKDRARRV